MKVKNYEGECGLCTKCGEWTEVTEPCCSAPVSFEGDLISIDDYEDEEEMAG